MANKFYEIGKASAQKITDYSGATSAALEAMYNQMIDSKEKLDAFMIKSPQGVSMDKVPEQARVYVTKFLADGKKRYAQAAAVVSSGISSSSQQYMDAIEVMNQVQNSFENLGTQLANYNSNVVTQIERAENIADGTNSWKITDFNNYITGDIFKDGKIDIDGNISYTSANTETKLISKWLAPKQRSDRGAEEFRAINGEIMQHKRNGDSWELISVKYEDDYDAVANSLGVDGVKDMVFSDDKYMQTLITANKEDDPVGYRNEYNNLVENPEEAIKGYKQYNMNGWKDIYDLSQGPKPQTVESKFFDGFTYSADDIGGYSAEMKSSDRKKIDQRTTYGDYYGRRGVYVYDSKSDTYTVTIPAVMSKDGNKVLIAESTKTYTPWQVLKEEGLLRDGETDPSKYKSASQSNNNTTPVAPETLFDVEKVVSNINQDIFMQKAQDAANRLEAIFVNIPGFKVRSTERGGVIVTYNNKRVEIPAGVVGKNTNEKDKQAIAQSKDTLIKWLQTVAIKPTI